MSNLEKIRLNKYLAHAGIANRREADQLIKKGRVKVNGEVVREMGYKVDPKDEVLFDNKVVQHLIKAIYLLLNKERKCSVQKDSPGKNIFQFIPEAEKFQLFALENVPTEDCGLLLVTNDTILADHLNQPKTKIAQIFQIELDKDLAESDLIKMQEGIALKGGPLKVDEIAFPDADDRKIIGLSLKDNRENIVRKLLENLGYHPVKIDRTLYGPLTKKNLPRGKWRMLRGKEIESLKNI